MKPAIRHLFLTKYNAEFPGSLGSDKGLNETWLSERLVMFRELCLMSMKLQTVQTDDWLIFVDKRTPENQLLALQETIGDAAHIVLTSGPLTDVRIREHVSAFLDDWEGKLITSRLDNDDAISSNYFSRVQQEAHGWSGFINAGVGFQLSAAGISKVRDLGGPFLTFVENRQKGKLPLTVFRVEHFRASEVAPVRQIVRAPLWLQCIHGNNLGNQLRGMPWSRRAAQAELGFRFPLYLETNWNIRRAIKAVFAQCLHELRWVMRSIRRLLR